MRSLVEKGLLRAARRLPVALCLLAASIQVAAPLLHLDHESVFPPAAEETASLHGSTCPHEDSRSHHDEATCPQCRYVVQLKSLSRSGLLSYLPPVRTAWIASSPLPRGRSQFQRDHSVPRAPPLSA